jgi:hypothetical protein
MRTATKHVLSGRTPAVLTLAACAASANAQTVYSQGPGTPVGWGFFSSTIPRANRSYKHADDFTLAQTATIDRLRWWGMSDFRSTGGLSNFSAFTIELFEANTAGTLPGSLLRTQTFLPALTSPTATGRVAFDTGATEFRQEVTLSTPIELLGNRKYFLAVSATPINLSGDSWMWQDGQFVNGLSALLQWNVTPRTVFDDTDSSFEIIAIPAPGAAAWAAPLALLAMRRHRRTA